MTDKKNASYKPFSAKIILFCIVLLMSISIISAFEFDNSKHILEKFGKAGYKDIEIKNAFGLGKKLWSGTLDYNTEQCIGGRYCEAIQTITLHEKGSLVDEVLFERIYEDEKRKQTNIRNYKVLIKTGQQPYEVDDYETQCTKEFDAKNNSYYDNCKQVKVGSHIEYNKFWKEYELGTELEAGTYEIKLEGEKKPSWTVDWIYKTQGETLKEWAEWKSDIPLNQNILAYYNLNESSGPVIEIIEGVNNGTATNVVQGVPALIENGQNYTGNSYTSFSDFLPSMNEYSMSLWFWHSSTIGDQVAPRLISSTSSSYDIQLGGGEIYTSWCSGGIDTSGANIPDNTWVHMVLTCNSTTERIYINGNLNNQTTGSYSAINVPAFILGKNDFGTVRHFGGIMDEFGIWNKSLTSSEVEELYNSGNGLTYPFSEATIILNSPKDNYISPINEVQFNATATITGGATLTNMSLWHNGTGTWHRNQTKTITGTENTTTFNSTFSDGNHLWGIEACDSDGDCGFSENRTVNIDTIPPIITINSPTSIMDYGFIGKNETLNWTITDTNLDSIWWEYNGTNTTLYGAENSTNFTLEDNLFNGTLWANDSVGNINNNFINWNYKIFVNNETYNSLTTSGIKNSFILNVTTNENPITIAYLNYNGTNYLGSIREVDGNYIITRNQTAPGVSTLTNISFYWNITKSDGFGILTDSQNQTINPIVINDTCGAGMYSIYNFTIADEVTQEILNPVDYDTSIKIDLNLYTSDRLTNLVHYYKEVLKINPFAICIDNNLSNNETYSLDFQVQYSSLNHTKEFYNLERYVLNSDTLYQNLTLYNLDTTNAQEFRLIVRDSSYLPIDGALVKIKRKYIENGTFYVTEIPKTDGKGITSASLQLNDVVYNFYIYDSETLVSSFTNVLAICQTPLVSTCEIDFNAFQSEITVPDYEEADDFNFTLGFNQTSRVISSNFIIPSGEPSTVKLIVTKEDALGTSICSDSLTSASGLLSCEIPSNFGNATVVAKLYKDDVEYGGGNIKLDQKSSDIFGVIAIMLSVLIMITLIGIGISDNPVVTAVFLFIGVSLLFGINLVQNNGFIGATATILFFAIAVILVIIKAARRS